LTLPTHLLAGLVIGKFTGNYPLALASAVLIDLDHLPSYFRHKVLFKPKELFASIRDANDPWEDQRGFLHNILLWSAISFLIFLANAGIGLVLCLAVFSHLALDALDSAPFYPFAPSKRVHFRGFVKYFSLQEMVFALGLLAVFIFRVYLVKWNGF